MESANTSAYSRLYLWAQGHTIKNIVREAGIGQDTLRKLVTEWRSLVCDKESPKLGGDGILVEADEVAIGSRKYQKGKRQRIGGVQWVQTILEVEEHGDSRKAKKLRAFLVDNRTSDTLLSNITSSVNDHSRVQTDGWRAYHGLNKLGYIHDSVNHNNAFVRKTKRGKITTNTIESSHSALKRRARQSNMFQGTRSTDLNPKIQELVFRFNNREGDIFVSFLVLLCVKFPVLPQNDLSAMFENLNL